MSEQPLSEPAWRGTRLALTIACAALGLGSLCGISLLLGARRTPGSDAIPVQIGTITAISCAVIVLVAFTAALTMRSSARAIDRFEEEVARGEALADWRFPTEEWAGIVEEERGARVSSGTSFLLVLMIVMAGVAATRIWSTVPEGNRRIRDMALLAALTMLSIGFSLHLARSLVLRSIARMQCQPRVVIGPNAVFIFGRLYRWNADMMELRAISVVAQAPMILEFTLGPDPAARTIGLMADLAALLGAGAGSKTSTVRRKVPVPAGKADDAERIVRQLLGRAAGLAPRPIELRGGAKAGRRP